MVIGASALPRAKISAPTNVSSSYVPLNTHSVCPGFSANCASSKLPNGFMIVPASVCPIVVPSPSGVM